MTEQEHYCELHEWKTIGQVSTCNGLLSIVAPFSAKALGKWWESKLDLGHRFREWSEAHRNFAQIDYDVRKHEDAMLVQCDNGAYDVEARFCDLYGTGHLSVCEVRLRLHYHDEDQDDEDDGLLLEVDP